jgi:hypothetical protein
VAFFGMRAPLPVDLQGPIRHNIGGAMESMRSRADLTLIDKAATGPVPGEPEPLCDTK